MDFIAAKMQPRFHYWELVLLCRKLLLVLVLLYSTANDEAIVRQGRQWRLTIQFARTPHRSDSSVSDQPPSGPRLGDVHLHLDRLRLPPGVRRPLQLQ